MLACGRGKDVAQFVGSIGAKPGEGPPGFQCREVGEPGHVCFGMHGEIADEFGEPGDPACTTEAADAEEQGSGTIVDAELQLQGRRNVGLVREFLREHGAGERGELFKASEVIAEREQEGFDDSTALLAPIFFNLLGGFAMDVTAIHIGEGMAQLREAQGMLLQESFDRLARVRRRFLRKGTSGTPGEREEADDACRYAGDREQAHLAVLSNRASAFCDVLDADHANTRAWVRVELPCISGVS